MSKRHKHHPLKRLVIDIAGFGLIALAPLLGWLPGPGGIALFAAGLGILTLNYEWAEKLLKDFDKKRVEFVEKYLIGNRKVALTIDFLAIFILLIAIFIYPRVDHILIKIAAIGTATFAVFIIISNQRRLDRFIGKILELYRKRK